MSIKAVISIDVEGNPDCLHCLLCPIIQQWIDEREAPLSEAVMAVANVLSELINAEEDEELRRIAMKAIAHLLLEITPPSESAMVH